MKKIIISLGVIGAVAAVIVGGTYALFNDTETSQGNVFTAGSIDLKVDHKYAMYNGNECTEDCVENTGVNLILNGDFENPDVTNPAKWQIFQTGTAGLEWTVEWVGGVTNHGGLSRPAAALAEYHEGVLGAAQHGDQYAELDSDWYGPSSPQSGEPALVKIWQNIATTPGAKYKLHYYFAPRPNTGVNENTMFVNIDGVLEQTTGPAAGGGSIVWTEYTKEFVATNATTKIEFVGGGGGGGGLLPPSDAYEKWQADQKSPSGSLPSGQIAQQPGGAGEVAGAFIAKPAAEILAATGFSAWEFILLLAAILLLFTFRIVLKKYYQ